MVVQYEEDLHGVASFFCKPTYRVCISVRITLKYLLTVGGLLDAGSCQNLVNKDFFPVEGRRS